jgi:hypothetical protein
MTLGFDVPFPSGGARPPEAAAQTPLVEKRGIAVSSGFSTKSP